MAEMAAALQPGRRRPVPNEIRLVGDRGIRRKVASVNDCSSTRVRGDERLPRSPHVASQYGYVKA
jgi:hypothetical protein